MALVNCKECGEKISESAKTCPKCGVRTSPSNLKFFIGIPAGLFAIFMAIGVVSPKNSEEQQAREGIVYCWQEQSRKSLDPMSQRFIAASCEQMEKEFIQRYGRKP